MFKNHGPAARKSTTVDIGFGSFDSSQGDVDDASRYRKYRVFNIWIDVTQIFRCVERHSEVAVS